MLPGFSRCYPSGFYNLIISSILFSNWDRSHASMLRYLNFSIHFFVVLYDTVLKRAFVKATSAAWWSAQGEKCQVFLFNKYLYIHKWFYKIWRWYAYFIPASNCAEARRLCFGPWIKRKVMISNGFLRYAMLLS